MMSDLEIIAVLNDHKIVSGVLIFLILLFAGALLTMDKTHGRNCHDPR